MKLPPLRIYIYLSVILRENIYEEKKIQSTKKLILTNVRLYNLSLTIYKCTENICTDSEILT